MCLISILSFQTAQKIYRNNQSHQKHHRKQSLQSKMAQLYDILKPQNIYFDRKYYQSASDYKLALQISTTVYVGNLSFFASQDSVYELFSMAGKVNEIIMGTNYQGHLCGFCFVVYEYKEQAAKAVELITRTKLHDRIIRVDWDAGYKEGREKGRGTGGQQRRDDFRTKQDLQRPRKVPLFESNRERQFAQRQRSRDNKAQRYDRNRKYFETKGSRPYGNDRNGGDERDSSYEQGENRHREEKTRYINQSGADIGKKQVQQIKDEDIDY